MDLARQIMSGSRREFARAAPGKFCAGLSLRQNQQRPVLVQMSRNTWRKPGFGSTIRRHKNGSRELTAPILAGLLERASTLFRLLKLATTTLSSEFFGTARAPGNGGGRIGIAVVFVLWLSCSRGCHAGPVEEPSNLRIFVAARRGAPRCGKRAW